MTAKEIASYSETATLRCERVFASVLRAVGSPWRGRVSLAGPGVPGWRPRAALLRYWPGGPRAAAGMCVASPVADDPFVASALERLGRDFASAAHAAPRDYGRFLAGAMTGSEFSGMRDEALLVWRQFAEERASLSGG